MSTLPQPIRGLLFDLDGTLYQAKAQGEAPIPGAIETLRELRRRGLPCLFVTNTTRFPRRELAARLARMGIAAHAEEILTAPAAAAALLRARGVCRLQLLVAAATREEFTGFELVDEGAEAVVVGDLGAAWTFPLLNQAFRNVLGGAELYALQRNRYWLTEGGLALDGGPFVVALEYATGKSATLTGKPSRELYSAALAMLGLPAAEVAMVGDDREGDVLGAKALGMMGIAVRTGKYRPEDEESLRAAADVVIDSVAELPALLMSST
jgi:HAD superfamily hydrolase (TIGR01458 family)